MIVRCDFAIIGFLGSLSVSCECETSPFNKSDKNNKTVKGKSCGVCCVREKAIREFTMAKLKDLIAVINSSL